jgi:serine/threonine-protein kinase HipA
MARNQDDHTKNIAFLIDKSGQWQLAPAYDATYSYNPVGEWTSTHQVKLGGKRDGFARKDLRAAASRFDLYKRSRLDALLEHVDAALERWPGFAARAGVEEDPVRRIALTHRRLADLPR